MNCSMNYLKCEHCFQYFSNESLMLSHFCMLSCDAIDKGPGIKRKLCENVTENKAAYPAQCLRIDKDNCQLLMSC